MKKILKSIIAMLMCLMLLFVGCSKNTVADSGNTNPEPPGNSNPFDAPGDNNGTVIEASYAVRPSVRSVVYDGAPIHLGYEIDNTGPSCEVGILVFINGIVQQYRTDADNNEKFVHSFDLEVDESIRPTLYIDPSVGSNGQTLYMGIMAILKPSFRQNVETPVAYGHNFSGTGAIHVSVEYRADSKQTSAKSTQSARVGEITQAVIDHHKEQSISFDYLNFRIDNLTGFKGDAPKATVGNLCRFTLLGVGGEEQDYRVCLFLDKEPYVFADGSTYIDFPIKKDKMTSADIEMDLSDWPEGTSATLYAVAIPITDDIDDYSSTQTSCFLLVKGSS